MPLTSRRSRPPPPNHRIIVAREEMIPAMPAATEPVRMSRLYTWDNSCPRTPRSSRSSRSWRMPWVAHTAAWWGSRPVAKALGLMVGATYRRGMG